MIYFNIKNYMIYTNKFINILSFIITCIVFFIINFNFPNIKDAPNISQEKILNIISKIEKPDKKNNPENFDNLDLGNWYLEIPSINLKAPISEGTEPATLNTKIGHFEDTASINGNIGLAAHNRGYVYNFFQNLKNVKIDDEIIYTYKDFKKTYIINLIEIIENSDWSYLEDSSNNKITLITCVENEPKYRRCVQAVEI